MYLFEAHYTEPLSSIDIIKQIEFDPQFFPTEEECYLYAMRRAYNLKQPGERFISLELVFS